MMHQIHGGKKFPYLYLYLLVVHCLLYFQQTVAIRFILLLHPFFTIIGIIIRNSDAFAILSKTGF